MPQSEIRSICFCKKDCEPTTCAPLASLRRRLWAAFVSGFHRFFVATGSRGSAASMVMLAAAVTAGVPSTTVRVPPAETFSAAVEARRMPAASHVEAARTPTANGLGSVPATKQMEATRVRWFSG